MIFIDGLGMGEKHRVEPGEPIDRAVLYLRADGTYRFDWLNRVADWADFERCLATLRSDAELGTA